MAEWPVESCCWWKWWANDHNCSSPSTHEPFHEEEFSFLFYLCSSCPPSGFSLDPSWGICHLIGGAIRIPFFISHMPSDHLIGKTTLSHYGQHFLCEPYLWLVCRFVVYDLNIVRWGILITHDGSTCCFVSIYFGIFYDYLWFWKRERGGLSLMFIMNSCGTVESEHRILRELDNSDRGASGTGENS